MASIHRIYYSKNNGFRNQKNRFPCSEFGRDERRPDSENFCAFSDLFVVSGDIRGVEDDLEQQRENRKETPVFPCRREKTEATCRVDFVLDGLKRYQNGTTAPFPRLYLHLRCSKSPCFQGFLDQAKAFKTYSHSSLRPWD